MRHTFTIFKWEMNKLLGNWQRTLAVLLLPAILLLAAINVFPLLMNYLSTGRLQSRPLTVVGAPDSFIDYLEGNKLADQYDITWLSEKKFEKLYTRANDEKSHFEIGKKAEYDFYLRGNDALRKELQSGEIFLFFRAEEHVGQEWYQADFDQSVKTYFSELAQGKRIPSTMNKIVIYCDSSSAMSNMQAEQFQLDIGDGYAGYLLDTLGHEYIEMGGGDRWEIDGFNPFQFVMKHRADANAGAARTIPCMLILLMYYCIYSLTAETMASARESGFLTKVYLTPISSQALLTGKALAVVTVGMVSATATFLLLFFSSWLNHSNSAFSMLPFGLFLTGGQLLVCFISLLVGAVFMAALCFSVVFSLRRMEDVMMNLQVPLALLIFDFFGMIFRPSAGLLAEYMIPLHNSAMVIRDVFRGSFSMSTFLVATAIDILLAILLFWRCAENKEGMTHISKGAES